MKDISRSEVREHELAISWRDGVAPLGADLAAGELETQSLPGLVRHELAAAWQAGCLSLWSWGTWVFRAR